MKIIGITGGIGSGKSTVLNYIKNNYNCKIYLTDEIANQLKNPGNKCYTDIINLLGSNILNKDLTINNSKMASIIFSDKELLQKVNSIIHPEVKNYILNEIENLKLENKTDFMFIESALLINAGYKEIVDETWYIDAATDLRRERLKQSRGYTDEKVSNIFKLQQKDELTKYKCDYIILNNNSFSDTCEQIDRLLLV